MNAYEQFEKIIFGFTLEAAELGGQTAVDGVEYGHIFHFEDRDMIREFRENSVKLSKSSLERLQGNVDRVMVEGAKAGKPIRELTKEVREQFKDFKSWEAERVARTEIARGVSEGALTGYGSMGIVVVEYYANAGACPLCSIRHGDLMTLDEARGTIPLHPNCYCFWLPRPDVTNKKVQGWKGLGAVSEDIFKALDIAYPYTRVNMAPEALDKIAGKGAYHPHTPEDDRLIVETAEAGIIDARNSLCLIQEHPEGGWNYIPIKYTDDYGMIAKTAYRIGPKRKKELMKKLDTARKRYGI